jgi:uncharacterized protein (TIGR02246 family)
MSASNAPSDEAQLRDLVESWASSVRARNIDGIIARHARDIVLFDVPPPVQVRGLDAYRTSWEQFFPWLGDAGVFEVRELSVTAGDDVAFCHGLIHCAGVETSGKKVELAVRLTVCFRKIDGQWLVVHEHHSEPSNQTEG